MDNARYTTFVGIGGADKLTERDRDLLGGLGLAGESGEVADIIKKVAFHGDQLDHDHLMEELGDTLWYLVLIADTHGITLEEIMSRNVTKLCDRYPDRYGDPSDWLD